jgi:SAM-dependent methyltransferase
VDEVKPKGLGQHASQTFWDERDRYELTPPRYSEVASIAWVRKFFEETGNIWRKNRKSINYVDLGCGDCRGTRAFADFLGKTTHMVIKTVGVDASAQCEQQCSNQNIEFVRLDLGSEPIPLRDFQVFTIFETIEHIFDTDSLVLSMRDSISKDGILLVTTLNTVCWKNRILVPLGIQPINTEVSTKKLSYGYRMEFLKKRVDTWKPAGHIRPFTLYSLTDLLEDNGFKVINSYGLENWRSFKFLEHIAKNMCTSILVIARPC